MTLQRLQGALFVGYVIWLYYSKYIYTNPTEFVLAYAANVAILVVLIAVIPFYISKRLNDMSAGLIRWYVIVSAPFLLTTIGLFVFYYFSIAPNYPNILFKDIVHRTFDPAIAMSLILALGNIPFGKGKPADD